MKIYTTFTSPINTTSYKNDDETHINGLMPTDDLYAIVPRSG